MDWMVTDERLSASVQSWTTDKDRERDSQAGAVGSSQNNSIGSAAQSSVASEGGAGVGGAVNLPGTMGLASSSALTASPLILPPAMTMSVAHPAGACGPESSVTNYPRFTKLSTPPPSPAPSPAVVPKRVSVSPGVVQLQNRQFPLKTVSSDPDLEKGEGEGGGVGRESGSSKLGAQSDSSGADTADRLADAVNGQFLAENAVKTHSGSQQGSFSRSNSYRTVSNYQLCFACQYLYSLIVCTVYRFRHPRTPGGQGAWCPQRATRNATASSCSPPRPSCSRAS